jgi:hypothetical protein
MNAAPITVRVIQQRGRLRLRATDGKYVQCPRAWREALPVGRALQVEATLRADGACWVTTPDGWAYEQRHAAAALCAAAITNAQRTTP